MPRPNAIGEPIGQCIGFRQCNPPLNCYATSACKHRQIVNVLNQAHMESALIDIMDFRRITQAQGVLVAAASTATDLFEYNADEYDPIRVCMEIANTVDFECLGAEQSSGRCIWTFRVEDRKSFRVQTEYSPAELNLDARDIELFERKVDPRTRKAAARKLRPVAGKS